MCGVVNDKLFLDIDDIVCIDKALLVLGLAYIVQKKPENWQQLFEQCQVTQKKIRDVYPEVFQKNEV